VANAPIGPMIIALHAKKRVFMEKQNDISINKILEWTKRGKNKFEKEILVEKELTHIEKHYVYHAMLCAGCAVLEDLEIFIKKIKEEA